MASPLLFAAIVRGQPPDVCLSEETPGFDRIVQTLISAFHHGDIVALGDDPGRKLDCLIFESLWFDIQTSQEEYGPS